MFDVSSLCRNFSQLSLTHRRTGSEHELETRDFYFHVEYCRYQYVLGVGTDTVLRYIPVPTVPEGNVDYVRTRSSHNDNI